MSDQYDEALALEEQQRKQYWECVEEDRPAAETVETEEEFKEW